MTNKETILSHLACGPFSFQFICDPYACCNYFDTEDKPEVLDMYVTHPLVAFFLDITEEAYAIPEAA